jgi:hypothetical protein
MQSPLATQSLPKVVRCSRSRIRPEYHLTHHHLTHLTHQPFSHIRCTSMFGRWCQTNRFACGRLVKRRRALLQDGMKPIPACPFLQRFSGVRAKSKSEPLMADDADLSNAQGGRWIAGRAAEHVFFLIVLHARAREHVEHV